MKTVPQIIGENKADKIVWSKIPILFHSGDDISISLIQRKCYAGYNSASRVFEELIFQGLIETPTSLNGTAKYK